MQLIRNFIALYTSKWSFSHSVLSMFMRWVGCFTDLTVYGTDTLLQIFDFLDLCQKRGFRRSFMGDVVYYTSAGGLLFIIWSRGCCDQGTTFPTCPWCSPALIKHNMAPAGRGVVVALSLLYLCRAIFSTEYFSTLTFFNSELHKHGCSSPLEWEEYASDCGETSVVLICHVLFTL